MLFAATMLLLIVVAFAPWLFDFLQRYSVAANTLPSATTFVIANGNSHRRKVLKNIGQLVAANMSYLRRH